MCVLNRGLGGGLKGGRSWNRVNAKFPFSVWWQLSDSVNAGFLWNEAGLSVRECKWMALDGRRPGRAGRRGWLCGVGDGGWGVGVGLCLNKLTWAWLGFLLCVKEQENTLTFASLKMEGQTCDTMTEESLALFFFFLLSLILLFSLSLPLAPFWRPPSSPSQSPPLNPIDRSHKKPFVSTSGCWHESRKRHEKCASFLVVAISSSQREKARERKREEERGKTGGKVREELSPGIKISELSFFFHSLPLPHSNCS